jgi:hypothetical protein
MRSASPFLNRMTTNLSSVEFPADAEVLPWLVALWLGVWALRPIATFIHELGHALPALAFTKAEVEVRIGESFAKPLSVLGRFGFACSFRSSFTGFTGYERESLKKAPLSAVILGGPLASGLACGFGVLGTLSTTDPVWLRISAAAFLCANGIVFLRSAIPVTLRPTAQFPDGPPSDGLDLWKTLRETRD